MSSPVNAIPLSLPNLEILEDDPIPTFITKISAEGLSFDIIYANEAFRKTDYRSSILQQTKPALLFRSWVQALRDTTSMNNFADTTWRAELVGITMTLKIVKAIIVGDGFNCEDGNDTGRSKGKNAHLFTGSGTPARERPADDLLGERMRKRTTLFSNLPRTHLDARWEGLQSMMEMSDVGFFEYNVEGKLLHANDAWYRLSSHPRDVTAHKEFSFKDPVYPDDQNLVMSKWNLLTQGIPVTFEMRWKPPVVGNAPQWVLAACVPILDSKRHLISIAGNTIDINAQKRSQEAVQARVEALEEARISETKFTRLAQLSPAAIFIFVSGIGMKFVNNQFYELTGHSLVGSDQTAWFGLIANDDVERVKEEWANLLDSRRSNGIQFRLKKTWVNQDGMRSNIWVENSNYPEVNEQGRVISIMGTLFNISDFKWAESVQQRRAEEALEAKRQQENFVDMTSHELGNPLNAVIQCANLVITTLQRLHRLSSIGVPADFKMPELQQEVSTSVEALQTIVLCSLHQKRIIDGLLTMSKLDSNLIPIIPECVQPVDVVREALRIFSVECNQADIQLVFSEDMTMTGINWVMLDPLRFLQVLINLLTNAIKFTKERATRKITVRLGSSFMCPPSLAQQVVFTTSDKDDTHITDKAEWGQGQKVYIWVTVGDTGCGMSNDEQNKLFHRFSQANPRNHVKYGGSGLGLFITRALLTLQGGAISVFSEANLGSTFAFYIAARLSEPPASPSLNTRRSVIPKVSYDTAMRAVKLNVLIVEDNLVNQKVLKKQLEQLGWNVNVAGDGTQALDWLKHSVYWWKEKEMHNDGTSAGPIENVSCGTNRHELDIILMDIEMPIMDGLACARSIREYERDGLLRCPTWPLVSESQIPASPVPAVESNRQSQMTSKQSSERCKRIPILAVSANARLEQVEQARAAGMDDMISKPFRLPELWPKMCKLLPELSATPESHS